MSHSKKIARRNRQAFYVFLLLGVLLCAAVYGWSQVANSQYLAAVFEGPTGQKSEKFYLDIADTPDLRKKGLMFVTNMEPNHGMVFVFPKAEVQTFWMKNTYIPLDMVFVGDDLQVVGIVEDAAKMTSDPRRVDKPSRYVVELNAGSAKRNGIAPGWKATFLGSLPQVSQ